MLQLLENFPRLKSFYDIGIVQRAELAEFIESIINSKVIAVTADNVAVEPGTRVWVNDSVGNQVSTTVKPLVATTTYSLFGLVPVLESFSTKEAAKAYYESA